MNVLRFLELACASEPHELRHQLRHHIGHHGDEPIAAQRQNRQRELVVAGEHGKAGGLPANAVGHLRQVSRRLLHTHDARMPREFERRRGLHVAAGASRHVVDDNREVDRVGDGCEVRHDATLRRLVVHGRNVQEVRCTRLTHQARYRDRFHRVVRTGAGYNGDASVHLLHRDLDNAPLFVE